MVPSFHLDLVRGVATYALEFFAPIPISTRSTCPSAWAPGSAAPSPRATRWALKTEIVGVQAEGAPSLRALVRGKAAPSPPTPPTRAPTAWRRARPTRRRWTSSCAAPRASCSSSDDEIAQAVRAYWTDTHNLAEGAGAAALAAALKERRSGKLGLVLSGGNIDFDLFQTLDCWGSHAMNKAYPPSPYSSPLGKHEPGEPHAFGAGRQRARRARARRRAVLGALVQYREPHGRRGRARERISRASPSHLRHAGGDRAGAPSVGAAGAGPFGDGPDAGGPRHRARTGDGEGARQGRRAGRGAATRRGVPRQGDRRDDRELHLRDHRRAAQDRRFRRPDAARSVWSKCRAPASPRSRAGRSRSNRASLFSAA